MNLQRFKKRGHPSDYEPRRASLDLYDRTLTNLSPHPKGIGTSCDANTYRKGIVRTGSQLPRIVPSDMTALLAVKGGDPGFHGSGIGGSGGSWLARLRHVIFYHRTGGGETEEEEEEMVRSRRKREKLEKKKRKEKRSFGARVTSERPSLLGGSEKERERAAGRGLLFRLLESRLVSEAGGPIGGVLPWTPRSVADQSCSIVARTCYIACRRAPPPGIARRPRVFPFVETFYATFPTTPLSLSPSLSLSLQRLRVRLSVRPSTLYICVCGSRPFVLLAKPPASSRPLHSSPSPSITLSLSLSLAPRFSLYRTSLASMEREARTAAHLFALIGGHR